MVHSRVDINRLKDTSYEVIISVLISDDDITSQSTLDCELKIPDTPYVKRKTFVFFQGRCIDLFFSRQIHRILKTNIDLTEKVPHNTYLYINNNRHYYCYYRSYHEHAITICYYCNIIVECTQIARAPNACWKTYTVCFTF